MSKLSKIVSNIGDSAKSAISHPISGLANVLTAGQLSRLRDLYNSSGTADLYNKNKSAIMQGAAAAALGAATGGAGAGAMGGSVGGGALAGGLLGGASGTMSGIGQDQARKANERALQAKDLANTNLNNLLPTIAPPTNTNPYPTDNGPVVMNPATGQPISVNDPAAQPLLNGGQVAINPTTSQPMPNGSMNRNVPVDNTSPNINTNLSQQDPALQARLKQILGTGTDAGTASAYQLANANDLASQLSTQTLNTQQADRQQQMKDLSQLLTEQAKTQYERSLPGLYEDLNTRGLLRSSDLGNQMATKEQQSYQDVANQLGQTQLGYNDQYINGLGNITNQYNSGVGSALQREMSLQDYAQQIKASQQLGQAVAPVTPYNSKGASTTAATAGLGKANAGAQLAQTLTKKP